MSKYHIYVTGPDAIGLAWITNIIEVANHGAKIKEGTIPSLRFPHSVSMELEADNPPAIARPGIRVFREDGSEILPGEIDGPVVEQPVVQAATFSMDEEGEDEVVVPPVVTTPVVEGEAEVVEGAKPESKVYTRAELDAMTWDEVKTVAKEVGVTGRDREKVIKGYLEKVAVSE